MAIASLVLWGVFVFVQTVRHRDYFLPPVGADDETTHAAPPSVKTAWLSFALLLVSLVAVIGLAKVLSPTVERALDGAGAPASVIGIVIAFVRKGGSETWPRRARHEWIGDGLRCDQPQPRPRLGAGEHRPTIPARRRNKPRLLLHAMLARCTWPRRRKDVPGPARRHLRGRHDHARHRTNPDQDAGVVHLVIFAAFVFLAFVP